VSNWAAIPSPNLSAVSIGPLTLHFYALCIIAGIVIAVRVGDKRFVNRGGDLGDVATVAFWSVPAGIIGGRIYHVITSWGSFSSPLDAIAIWRGGLGIWGAISLGTVGAWLGYRSLLKSKPQLPTFGVFLDALAPGVLLAQAVGRWGNWFNIELFGKPLNALWALQVPIASRPNGYAAFTTFHPTFLYESLWCVAVAILLIMADKAGFFGRAKAGTLFIAYVALYTLGRGLIEVLRIDSSAHVLGMRLNFWSSLVIFVGFSAWFVARKVSQKR
jgi:prolipoprotein diacylglyceryl transferase